MFQIAIGRGPAAGSLAQRGISKHNRLCRGYGAQAGWLELLGD